MKKVVSMDVKNVTVVLMEIDTNKYQVIVNERMLFNHAVPYDVASMQFNKIVTDLNRSTND